MARMLLDPTGGGGVAKKAKKRKAQAADHINDSNPAMASLARRMVSGIEAPTEPNTATGHTENLTVPPPNPASPNAMLRRAGQAFTGSGVEPGAEEPAFLAGLAQPMQRAPEMASPQQSIDARKAIRDDYKDILSRVTDPALREQAAGGMARQWSGIERAKDTAGLEQRLTRPDAYQDAGGIDRFGSFDRFQRGQQAAESGYRQDPNLTPGARAVSGGMPTYNTPTETKKGREDRLTMQRRYFAERDSPGETFQQFTKRAEVDEKRRSDEAMAQQMAQQEREARIQAMKSGGPSGEYYSAIANAIGGVQSGISRFQLADKNGNPIPGAAEQMTRMNETLVGLTRMLQPPQQGGQPVQQQAAPAPDPMAAYRVSADNPLMRSPMGTNPLDRKGAQTQMATQSTSHVVPSGSIQGSIQTVDGPIRGYQLNGRFYDMNGQPLQ